MHKLRAAAVVVAAALVVGPLSLTRVEAGPACPGVTGAGDWLVIESPFEALPLTAYAVDPLDPTELWATDGKHVEVTHDGGCSWTEAFALGLPSLDVLVLDAAATIRSIEVPESPAGARRVYLVVEESLPGLPVGRIHVVASSDEGKTWAATDDGLPVASGHPVELVVSPRDPDVLYLFVRNLGPGTDDVYASEDAGATWERRSDDAGLTVGVGPDPLDTDELWSWGGSGLRHSTNGGRTWPVVNTVAGSVTLGDVFHGPQGPARIMAYEPETQTFSVSQDGGAVWNRIGGPRGVAISMAHGNSPDDIVMSVHEGVYRFKAPYYWIEITPRPLLDAVGDLRALSADRTADPSVFALATDAIVGYTGLDRSVELLPFDAGTLAPAAPPRLVAGARRIAIAPGASARVAYTLDLPPKPTPLDVFFLVDTSQSMTSSINGLRDGMQRVIDELAASGIDVQFGLGEYKDYPIAGYGDPLAGDVPYRLNRAIGPADAALADALETLTASGGGDIHESQLTALYQAVTGEGQLNYVPPGGDAGFRPGALPTIVHITDAPFHSGPAYPSPPFATVVSELRRRGVLQIGLAVFGPNGVRDASRDLTTMAGETGTVAASGGVDCDGDREIDVEPGAAMVCELRDETSRGVLSIAPAIIATLRAVSEKVPVGIEVTGADGVTARPDPTSYPSVDLRDGNRLVFTITYTCPVGVAGTTRTVRVATTTRGETIDAATTAVRCRPLVPPEPPVLPAPIVAIAAPVLLPPPPQPPHQIPAQQPNTQPQGVLAQQKQEQAQPAFVQSGGVAEREQYAFSSLGRERDGYSVSSLRRQESGPPAQFFAAAAAMAMAFALATRTQHRVRVARQPR